MNESAITLQQEELRIKALESYFNPDSPKDNGFDRITCIAAIALKMPIAIISFVGKDHIWYKSTYGLAPGQIARGQEFCAAVIESETLYHVENAALDQRTHKHPLVTGSFGLRFYAALPLKVAGGCRIGTIGLMDKNSNFLNDN